MLAHEFGHYYGGDTKLGPWIYKTRAAIGRTLQALQGDSDRGFDIYAIIQAPFRWYGNMYLRTTLAISRAQEFAADRLAARVIGSAAMIEGLRTVHRVAGASNYYLNNPAKAAEAVDAFRETDTQQQVPIEIIRWLVWNT